MVSSPTSLKSPCPLYVHWRIQISTSDLCMMNTGPELASKLFVMPQIMLVRQPLRIRFSVSTKKMYTFS